MHHHTVNTVKCTYLPRRRDKPAHEYEDKVSIYYTVGRKWQHFCCPYILWYYETWKVPEQLPFKFY